MVLVKLAVGAATVLVIPIWIVFVTSYQVGNAVFDEVMGKK